MPQTRIPENNLTPQERNKLIEDNINLARYFAHKLCKDVQLIDDCIQEGCSGLIRAARLFDESRHNSFSVFAAFEIQCSIRDFLFRNRMIKLPDDQRKQINAYQTKVRQMASDNIDVTTEVLIATASEVGISKEVHNQLMNPIGSLNVPVTTQTDSHTEIGDIIPDDINEDPVSKLAYEELVAFMKDFFESAKIADDKTRVIVLNQMQQMIDKAWGKPAYSEDHTYGYKSLTQLVASEYPELDTKSKEFNRHYTRISGVWCNQLNKFKEALSSVAAYI